MDLTVEYLSQDSLITAQEVVDYSPVSTNSHGDMRANFLALKEEKLFRKCFGWEFYQALMDDRVIYRPDASGDVQYVVFREGTSYAVDDVVLHEGRLYTVTIAVTGSQRPSLDVTNRYFKLAPRFTTEEYNFIWERYLRTIIAFSISETSVFYRAIQDTATGLVRKYNPETSAVASLRELSALKGEYAGDIGDMVKNMTEFILDHKELAIFAEFGPIKEACNSQCQPRNRHHGFNTNKYPDNQYY